jgi:NAD(P)-dependent dehydrogenase (short-subunit alcohol dehydrogenase family)
VLCVEQRLGRGQCGVGVHACAHEGLHDGPIEVLAGQDVQRQFATNVFGLLTMTVRYCPPCGRASRAASST